MKKDQALALLYYFNRVLGEDGKNTKLYERVEDLANSIKENESMEYASEAYIGEMLATLCQEELNEAKLVTIFTEQINRGASGKEICVLPHRKETTIPTFKHSKSFNGFNKNCVVMDVNGEEYSKLSDSTFFPTNMIPIDECWLRFPRLNNMIMSEEAFKHEIQNINKNTETILVEGKPCEVIRVDIVEKNGKLFDTSRIIVNNEKVKHIDIGVEEKKENE